MILCNKVELLKESCDWKHLQVVQTVTKMNQAKSCSSLFHPFSLSRGFAGFGRCQDKIVD